ncbi:MAG: hypothetical protein WC178_04875 [Candidatus Paceibacterota bacterium]
MKIVNNERGAILLVLIIAIAIIGFLFINGYIKETKKGQEVKQGAKENIEQIQSDLENTVKERAEENLEAVSDNIDDIMKEVN